VARKNPQDRALLAFALCVVVALAFGVGLGEFHNFLPRLDAIVETSGLPRVVTHFLYPVAVIVLGLALCVLYGVVSHAIRRRVGRRG
jgi:hypothetical protein